MEKVNAKKIELNAIGNWNFVQCQRATQSLWGGIIEA